MNKLIVPFLAIAAFATLSACKTEVVEPRGPSTHSTTTTTDQSSVQQPVSSSSTTETRSSN